MLKRLLTGGDGAEEPNDQGGQEGPDGDPAYLGQGNAATQQPTEGNQDQRSGAPGDGSPSGDPGDLRQQVEKMEKRLRDAQRHIHRIEGENQSLSQVVAQLGHQPGGQPEDDNEPDPGIDDETLQLFQRTYEENPAEAVAAMIEYGQRKTQKFVEDKLESRDRAEQQQSQQRKVQQNLRAQLARAVEDFGEPALKLAREFLNSQNENEAAQTLIGQMLVQDPGLLQTQEGLYHAVGMRLVQQGLAQRDQVGGESSAQHPSPDSGQGVSQMPSAPSRSRGPRNPGNKEGSVEDQIGDAILGANRGSADESARNIFQG